MNREGEGESGSMLDIYDDTPLVHQSKKEKKELHNYLNKNKITIRGIVGNLYRKQRLNIKLERDSFLVENFDLFKRKVISKTTQ
jgi:hypothetical protein